MQLGNVGMSIHRRQRPHLALERKLILGRSGAVPLDSRRLELAQLDIAQLGLCSDVRTQPRIDDFCRFVAAPGSLPFSEQRHERL